MWGTTPKEHPVGGLLWQQSRGQQSFLHHGGGLGAGRRASQSCWGSPCAPQPARSAHWDLGLLSWDFPGLLTRVPLCTSVPTVPSDRLARPSPSDMPSWLRSAESNPTPGDPVSFLQLHGTRERPASLSNRSFVVTPIFDTHVLGHLLKGQSVSSMPHARHPTRDGAAAELPSWASAERRRGSQRADCDRLGGGGQHLSVPVTPTRCLQRAQVCPSLRPGRRGTKGSRGEGGAYPRSMPAG